MNAEQVIELLGLEPLPVEGGRFRETYVAAERLEPGMLGERYRVAKPLATAIYYLLDASPDSFSALHRLPSDEIYHFYLGDPVEMLELHPDGRSERIVLGAEIGAGQRVQHVVARGVWQGSRLMAGGSFALLGTTMAPGFTSEDYTGGDRETLLREFPQAAELIRALTRG